MATDKLINETQGTSMINALEGIAQNLEDIGSVSLAKLGMGYAICDVAAATAAKTANLANYALNEGGFVSIKFTYANTASSATLNINSTGAKAIYYKGAAIAGDVIKAGDIALFQYANGVYNLITLDNPFTTAQINALNSGVDSTKVAQIETNKNNILITNIPYLDVIIQAQGTIGSNTKIWKQGNHVFGQIVITSPHFNIGPPIITLAYDFRPAYEQIQPCVCMDAGELPITGYYNITTAGEIILHSESMNIAKVSIPIDFVIS